MAISVSIECGFCGTTGWDTDVNSPEEIDWEEVARQRRRLQEFDGENACIRWDMYNGRERCYECRERGKTKADWE